MDAVYLNQRLKLFFCKIETAKTSLLAMVTTNDDPAEFPDESSSKGKHCFRPTNDDPAEFPDESSSKGKHCFRPCRISSFRFPEDLREELVYEIFVRLPVKSLIRFRCVSKGMRRLIDSPLFIKNHNIHRSVIRERDREYAIFLHQPMLHRLFSLNFDKEEDNNNNNNLNRAKAIELDSTFLKEGMMEEGMGWCCNGIFCFKNCDPTGKGCVFWNPSNGTFRKVDCSSFHLSMGYDYVNDDYKLIRFMNSEGGSETSVEVYSFRKDSWRKFRRDFPMGQYGPTKAVCLSGVMHHLWINHTDKSMFIAAFDLAKETFTSLPLPLEARKLKLRPCHFTDFRGRLCITFFPPGYVSRMHGPQTIWVMEKYGVESSWSKLYSFDYALDLIPNFYFPNSRRRLLCSFKWLSWWDPQDGSNETIEIPGLLNDQALYPGLYFYEAYIYVRNLVRLDQGSLFIS